MPLGIPMHVHPGREIDYFSAFCDFFVQAETLLNDSTSTSISCPEKNELQNTHAEFLLLLLFLSSRISRLSKPMQSFYFYFYWVSSLAIPQFRIQDSDSEFEFSQIRFQILGSGRRLLFHTLQADLAPSFHATILQFFSSPRAQNPDFWYQGSDFKLRATTSIQCSPKPPCTDFTLHFVSLQISQFGFRISGFGFCSRGDYLYSIFSKLTLLRVSMQRFCKKIESQSSKSRFLISGFGCVQPWRNQ